MRITILFFLLLFSPALSRAQRYNTLIPDSQITSFISWMVVNDSRNDEEPEIVAKFLSVHITSWKESLFSTIDGGSNYSNRVLLDTVFPLIDKVNVYQQLKAAKDSLWHDGFEHIRLVKNAGIRLNTYYYSLPLFSLDRNYVVIHKSYYCGELCGYFGYYIYRRKGEGWEYIGCVGCGLS